MKKIIISGLILFSTIFLSASNLTYAQGGMMGINEQEQQVQPEDAMQANSVDAVLADILKTQSVTTVQKLNISKISDDEWERLGDAAMELQHPGKAHEMMDQMMGGEGSESLRQVHINMGKAYLGYGQNYGYGMMGGNMMGNWNNNTKNDQRGGGSYMMGNYGYNPMGYYGGGFGFIAIILFWGLIIFGVVVLLKWVLSQSKISTQGKSTLDIIKERYAKGEIDKKEFEEMKKDLK